MKYLEILNEAERISKGETSVLPPRHTPLIKPLIFTPVLDPTDDSDDEDYSPPITRRGHAQSFDNILKTLNQEQPEILPPSTSDSLLTTLSSPLITPPSIIDSEDDRSTIGCTKCCCCS